MTTDKKFITEENEEKVFIIIEIFLNRWKEIFKAEHPDTPETLLNDFLPTDEEMLMIIKSMLKIIK